eukprot:2796373-Pleurochrysis_carterae.AAC.3
MSPIAPTCRRKSASRLSRAGCIFHDDLKSTAAERRRPRRAMRRLARPARVREGDGIPVGPRPEAFSPQ